MEDVQQSEFWVLCHSSLGTVQNLILLQEIGVRNFGMAVLYARSLAEDVRVTYPGLAAENDMTNVPNYAPYQHIMTPHDKIVEFPADFDKHAQNKGLATIPKSEK